MTTKGAPPTTFVRKMGGFLRHFLQMCLAMCVGALILHLFFTQSTIHDSGYDGDNLNKGGHL